MTDDDRRLLVAFEDRSLPPEQWNHRAHLRVSYLYLVAHPFDMALAHIRRGIQAYNAATGVVEGRTMGYHETLTVAWARLIRAAIAASPPARDSEAFLEQHPELSVKTALRAFYSAERIGTWEAKRSFVEPDESTLPRVDEEADAVPAPGR